MQRRRRSNRSIKRHTPELRDTRPAGAQRHAGKSSVAQSNHAVVANVATLRPNAAPIQRNAFLNNISDANDSIDYGQLVAANEHDNLHRLHLSIGPVIARNQRRQAALLALQDEDVMKVLKDDVLKTTWRSRYMGGLTSSGMDIRSSHSGGAIDQNLPQAPYDLAPGGLPPAAPAVAPPPGTRKNIRNRANYEWLKMSTTDHTRLPAGQPPSASRVASYFEFHAPSVTTGAGVVVDGTRLVYDPFNERYFVSAHYQQQYEIVNVGALNQHPTYLEIRQLLQADRQANALWAGVSEVARGIFNGEY